MSPRRVVDWRIEQNKDETYNLFLRNKLVLQDSSMTAIKKYLKRHRSDGQTVHEVADDGYVTDRTRAIERRQRRRSVPGVHHRPVRMPFARF